MNNDTKNTKEAWEDFYERGKGAKYPDNDIIKIVRKAFKNAEDISKIKILDLGCGMGNHLWFLAKEGFDAYGVDISEFATRTAENFLKKENLSAYLKAGDFRNLDYPDGYFDGVVCSRSIEANAIEDIKKILKEVHRILKPNGKFLSEMISDETYFFKDNEMIEKNTTKCTKALKRGGIMHFFTREEIYNLLEEAGFKNISVEYVARSLNNLENITKFWIVEAEKLKIY